MGTSEYLTTGQLRNHIGEADCYTVSTFAPGWTAPDAFTVDDIDQVLIACESFADDLYRYTDNTEITVYAGDVLVRATNGAVIGTDGYPECIVTHNENGWTVEGA